MREQFWTELNAARSANECRLWKGVFPEAAVLDINCVCEINQYLTTHTGANAFGDGGPMLTPVHGDPRVRPFYTEFINNIQVVGTEINWNSLFFFSLVDTHSSFSLHSDVETVFLIQGYGEVAMIVADEHQQNKQILHLQTGDALLLPPLYNHKPIPMGPRVTLSLGALPKKHEQPQGD